MGAPSQAQQRERGKQEGEEKIAEGTNPRHFDPRSNTINSQWPLRSPRDSRRDGTAVWTVTVPRPRFPVTSGSHSSVYLGHANADHEHPAQARVLQHGRRHGSSGGHRGKRDRSRLSHTEACAQPGALRTRYPALGVGGGASASGAGPGDVGRGSGGVGRLRTRSG